MKGPRPYGRIADWAELLRVSAAFTVPGDALAGAAASGHRPDRGTLLAAGASLCLYEAGMALNDFSDRGIDAVERPDRPLPSGRIPPAAALAASAVLTAAGLRLAAASGRPALLTATALAGTVWAYDLRLKHTALGPAAMAAARALDLTLGAVATAARSGRPRAAGGPAATRSCCRATAARPGAVEAAGRSGDARASAGARQGGDVARAALMLGAHTFAVTGVSRRETLGAPPALPLAATAAVAALACAAGSAGRVPAAFALTYAAAAARPLAHAALNPSPPLLQRAVGGGIRATIPLQAALTARAGRPVPAAAVLALLPLARRLSRKVSPT